MTTYPKASDLQRATESRLTANPIHVDSDNLTGHENDSYQWFIVRPNGQLESGWEYKSDANEMLADMPSGSGYKVVHRRTLKAQGVDPSDAANWGPLKGAINPARKPGTNVEGLTWDEWYRAANNFHWSDRPRPGTVAFNRQRDMWHSGIDPTEVAADPHENPARRNSPARAIQCGMDRAIWVVCFANWVDEQGPSARKKYGAGPGQDWNDVAPDSPLSAQDAAMELANLYRLANGKDVLKLLADAHRASGALHDAREYGFGDEYAEAFGHALAMMAMGTGVSWFDDHARFSLKIPNFEAYCPDGMSVEWSPKKLSTQNPRSRR